MGELLTSTGRTVGRPVPVAVTALPEFDPGGWHQALADGAAGVVSSSGVILPTDDRLELTGRVGFPYTATVHVTSTRGPCSGWLYGRNVVATAAHCLHDGASSDGGAWASGVAVTAFVFDGMGTAIGCGGVELAVPRGWIVHRGETYDYGVLSLDCDLGQLTGWLSLAWNGKAVGTNAVEVVGTTKGGPARLWSSIGVVRGEDGNQLFYDSDVAPGMSGGPVARRQSNQLVPIAIGTNAAHQGPELHRRWNHGPKIRYEVFEMLRAWRNGS